MGRRLPWDASDQVIQRLFAAIGDHVRDRAIFTLILHAGLRVGEVAKLGVNDVNLSGERAPHLHLNGKGQRERVALLPATAADLLGKYLATRPAGSEYRVFLNRRGQPISITGIQLQLAKYCKQAAVWVTCHQLRHTFACRIIAAGAPVTSLQKMLGHASLRTTRLTSRWLIFK